MPLRPHLIAALLLALTMSMFAPNAHSDGRYGKQKAVYDINYAGGENDKAYFLALRNVKNHINAVGKDNIELKIVLSGDGLNMLKAATTNLELQGMISNLKTQKAAFLVCNNTLVGRKIDSDTLFEVFKDDIVPSGNAEIGHLQSNGYSYHKP